MLIIPLFPHVHVLSNQLFPMVDRKDLELVGNKTLRLAYHIYAFSFSDIDHPTCNIEHMDTD